MRLLVPGTIRFLATSDSSRTWGSWTECLPTSGPNSYCPSDCPTGEVACDLVEDYLPNGTSLGFVTPSVKCATSHENCPCGKEAERCPNTGCIFKDEGCPVTCGANEKKCAGAHPVISGGDLNREGMPSGWIRL
eukprot:g32798.t1